MSEEHDGQKFNECLAGPLVPFPSGSRQAKYAPSRAFLVASVNRFYGVDCSLLPDQELIAMHLAIPKVDPDADTPTIVER